jgi:hypothetical protein
VYRLTVEALPGDVPAPVRLKRLLKGVLRGYGFRCLEAREVPSGPPPPGLAAPAGGSGVTVGEETAPAR